MGATGTRRGQPATLAMTADNRRYNLGGGGRLNKTHLPPGAQLELQATELGMSTVTPVCIHALPLLEEGALGPLLGSTQSSSPGDQRPFQTNGQLTRAGGPCVQEDGVSGSCQVLRWGKVQRKLRAQCERPRGHGAPGGWGPGHAGVQLPCSTTAPSPKKGEVWL